MFVLFPDDLKVVVLEPRIRDESQKFQATTTSTFMPTAAYVNVKYRLFRSQKVSSKLVRGDGSRENCIFDRLLGAFANIH